MLIAVKRLQNAQQYQLERDAFTEENDPRDERTHRWEFKASSIDFLFSSSLFSIRAIAISLNTWRTSFLDSLMFSIYKKLLLNLFPIHIKSSKPPPLKLTFIVSYGAAVSTPLVPGEYSILMCTDRSNFKL